MSCVHRLALAADDTPSCGPDPVCSMWITSETGTLHYGCAATRESAEATMGRYRSAGVAISTEIGECCHADDVACAFDVFGDDNVDEIVMLSYALMRAEGRSGTPPHRCSCCGHMTYGGCCA